MAPVQIPSFGVLLKRYRLAAGLSQDQLAERAGMSKSAISALERGSRQRPYTETVTLLITALGLQTAEQAQLQASVRRWRERAVVPAPSPSDLPPVPTPLTKVIGREREIAMARRVLRDQGRLLTVTGPPGVGKTRLALELARILADRYADGAAFVPLASLRDAGLVLPTVAQALGLRDQGPQAPESNLADYLRARHLLLVLDNIEHVATALAPHLAQLLSACPGLTVLVTGQVALSIRGEQLLPLAPLEPPDVRHACSLDALAAVPAVALFVERAQCVRPDFALTARNAAAVATICRRLEGLPLAIELAATRVAVLPPQMLQARLEHRLQMLIDGPRDLPERQRSLRGAILWSYELLTYTEQMLFRRLTTFVGGCTLEAAEAVCGTSGAHAGEVLGVLSRLVERSLLHVMEEPDGGARFAMLETIGDFGREQLATAGEEALLRQRHASYFLNLAEEAEGKLHGPEQAIWLTRIECEIANVREALRWALAGEAVEMGLRIAASLTQFWLVRGYLREGCDWLEAFLALVDRTVVAPIVVAHACQAAGRLAAHQGDLDQAARFHERALAIYQQEGDARGIAQSFSDLGLIASYQGRYEPATAWHEQSLALRRQIGDRFGVASSLMNLGVLAHQQGNYALAAAHYEESLAHFRSLGHQRGVARALTNLGLVAHDQGRYGRAVALREEALALFEELKDKTGTAELSVQLGQSLAGQGDYARARPLFLQGVRLFQQVNNRLALLYALPALAQVESAQGQLVRTVRMSAAIAAARQAAGVPLTALEQDAFDRDMAAARAAMDARTFQEAWDAGHAQSLEDTIAAALAEC